MDVYLHKLITISNRKLFGKICSEIHLIGTNLDIPFINKEENLKIDSKYSINIKEIKSEIDILRKVAKTIIFRNGEPFLQRIALKNLVQYAKQKGMYIAIETYGTSPNLIKELIDKKLVDMIILKAYFPLNELWLQKICRSRLISNYKDIISQIKNTITILENSKINVQAKTCIVDGIIANKNDVSKIINPLSKIRNLKYEIINLSNNINNDQIEEIKNHITNKFKNIKIKD
ncbi:MAG: hypothetical protein ACMXYG_06715 [Candidatus Woesearchaeota archaeon]